jgi:hypothetical protein
MFQSLAVEGAASSPILATQTLDMIGLDDRHSSGHSRLLQLRPSHKMSFWVLADAE